jgi:hypothetical protein
MADTNKVVVHSLGGKLLKGTTQDFFPNRPIFHVQPHDGKPPVEVRTQQLKAIFFVRDYLGQAKRRDVRGFISGPSETAQGKKLAVRFKDGELLCGYSLSYSPERDGFFMFPADAGSNNVRVFVVTAACADVKSGPAAEAMALKSLGNEAA